MRPLYNRIEIFSILNSNAYKGGFCVWCLFAQPLTETAIKVMDGMTSAAVMYLFIMTGVLFETII